MRQPLLTPVVACGAPPATSHHRYVAVVLLTRNTLYFSVDVQNTTLKQCIATVAAARRDLEGLKCRINMPSPLNSFPKIPTVDISRSKCKLSELYAVVAEYLSSQGMQDTNLFGLAIPIEDEYVFVDLESKISKYAPKIWRIPSSTGLDEYRRPFLQFSFRVKFYVDCHQLLRCRVTRHHYYLQLRENVLRHKQRALRQNTSFLLAAWALQADLGDYHNQQQQQPGQYFQPSEYFPDWVIANVGVECIVERMPEIHAENAGMSRSRAQLAYIREASAVEAPHNLHIYRLRRRKCHSSAANVLLGVCPNGVELHEEEKDNSRKLLASFVWTNISNLSFEKRKFEIRALSQRFTFYASHDDKAKQLLSLCREMHMFTQSLKDRLADLKQTDADGEDDDDDEAGTRGYDSSRYESGVVSTGGCWEYLQSVGASRAGRGRDVGDNVSVDVADDPRTSVLSSTSSNTTSGVVSDRTTHSLDGSEDDEGLTNCPAAAVSLESGMESVGDSSSLPTEFRAKTSPASRSTPKTAVRTIMPVLAARSVGHKTFNSDAKDQQMAAQSINPSSIVVPAEAAPVAGYVEPSSPSPRRQLDTSRAGSAHSSSSQQSGATVRSRCSLLLNTSVQSATAAAALCSDAGADNTRCRHRGVANCCSTCGGDEDDEHDEHERQGATQAAGLGVDSAGAERRCGEHAQQHCSLATHEAHDSTLSVASTHDSSDAVARVDRAEFYNLSEDYGSGGDLEPPESEDKTRAPPVASPRRVTAASDEGVSGAAAADALDYSVHSAHTCVGSVVTTPGTFPRRTTVSATFDTDSDYVRVPYDEKGEFRMRPSPPPAAASSSCMQLPVAASMARVKTVTHFSLAQSSATVEPSQARPDQHAATVLHVRLLPAFRAAECGETVVRVITSRAMVTVFRAQVSAALVDRPQFACRLRPVSARAAAIATIRRFCHRQRMMAAAAASSTHKPRPLRVLLASLQQQQQQQQQQQRSSRSGLVVGGNNYLDVHASRASAVHSLASRVSCVSRASSCESTPSRRQPRYANLSPSERLQQQLMSDADYVIYPLKDPDISRQEYMDAKHCSLTVDAAVPPPPPPPPYPPHQQQTASWRSLATLRRGHSPQCRSKPLEGATVARARSDDNLLSGGSTAVPRPPPPSYWESGGVARTLATPTSRADGRQLLPQRHQSLIQRHMHISQQQQGCGRGGSATVDGAAVRRQRQVLRNRQLETALTEHASRHETHVPDARLHYQLAQDGPVVRRRVLKEARPSETGPWQSAAIYQPSCLLSTAAATTPLTRSCHNLPQSPAAPPSGNYLANLSAASRALNLPLISALVSDHQLRVAEASSSSALSMGAPPSSPSCSSVSPTVIRGAVSTSRRRLAR